MKLSTSSQELLAQLQVVSRVASTRSAVQALSGVQIAADDAVQLRATDMEVALRVPLEATIERSGTVVLPARLLLDVVRQLPSGDVSLELRPAEQDVEVVAGTARFHIRTLRAEDFPHCPSPAATRSSRCPRPPSPRPSPACALGVARRDASHPHRHPGVRGRRRAAHGGHRLLSPERQGDPPRGLAARRLRGQRPARALEELGRLVREDIDDIRIGVRANQVVFEVDGVALSSRLIDGQFPNYRQLLPEAYEHELTVNREELLEVVRRISLMAQKNAPLRLSFSEGEVSISAQTPDVGRPASLCRSRSPANRSTSASTRTS